MIRRLTICQLTGGDLSGLLNINVSSGVALSINTNKVKFWSSGAVELNGYTAFKTNELVTKSYVDTAIRNDVDLSGYMPLSGGKFTGYVQFEDDTKQQMGGTYNKNINDGIEGFTYNSIVATLGYVKHAINALGGGVGAGPVPAGAKKLTFAQDTPIANLRPGQFTLKNGNTYTNKWSVCTSLTMKATDADGNRLIRGKTQASGFNSYLGSAMTTLDAAGEESFLRVVPTGQGGGYVVLSYAKDVDLISVDWTASACSQLLCDGDPYVTNGTDYLIHIPDLFF